MPKSQEKKRGGVVRYRAKKLKHGKYITFAVVRKAGPKGGHTIASKPKKRKYRYSPQGHKYSDWDF